MARRFAVPRAAGPWLAGAALAGALCLALAGWLAPANAAPWWLLFSLCG